MPEHTESPRDAFFRLPSSKRGKIAYFAAGVLFIVLSRFFVPFWPRFIILSFWAVGLALIFIRQLESSDHS